MASVPVFSPRSALVVLAPEAEELVRPFRERYDPSAAAEMPAHITLLYPFKPPDEVSDAVVAALSLRFARFRQFDFALTAIRRFAGGVLYLAPEPDEPFRRLTLAISERHPETPPYGGRYSTIVPHLTVAQLTNAKELDSISDQFARIAQENLPIRATAREIALMENQAGHWRVRTSFTLSRS